MRHLTNDIVQQFVQSERRYNDSHVPRSSSLICNCRKKSIERFLSPKVTLTRKSIARDSMWPRVEALWTSERTDVFNSSNFRNISRIQLVIQAKKNKTKHAQEIYFETYSA